ncbi:MAG TPA: 16S rRNA (adenine(1518)-N(6)/adenine(1519)-N(6))-dimethyltransferase RsmA [Thermodesulfobacteriota bacterium]
MARLEHRPRKRFGQHFLRDPGVLDRIVETAAIGPDDSVIEIGAGTGALTRRLAARAGRLLAVEIDRDLAARLREAYAGSDRVEILEADILRVDLPALAERMGGRPVVVGNLPYNISSPLLFALIDARRSIARMVLMVQREFGERLAAAPGSAAYGALSVLAQLHLDIRVAFHVPPAAFRPPPAVESSVLVLTPRPAPAVAIGDEARFRRVVRAAFAQRRKTLANALRAAGLGPASPQALSARLAEAGIDGRRRGETLGLAEFARLDEALARPD